MYAFLDMDEGTWSWSQTKGQKRGYIETTIMGVLFSPLELLLIMELLMMAEERFGDPCGQEGLAGTAGSDACMEQLADIPAIGRIITLWGFSCIWESAGER